VSRRRLPEGIPAGVKIITTADEYSEYFDRYGFASVRSITEDGQPFGRPSGYIFLDDRGAIVAFAWPEVAPRRSRPRGNPGTKRLPRHIPASAKIIESPEEWREFRRRFGPPWAVDVGHGLFGARAGTAFVDDDRDGLIVGFAWPEVHPHNNRDNPRQNPEPSDAALRTAVGVYEGFHAYDSDEVGMLDIDIPASVLYGGPATWVTYASDKWEDRSHDYIHTITSQPRVFCGLAGAGAGRRRKVPNKIRKTTVLAQLGLRALGFAFIGPDGDELEVRCPRGTRWFWSPQGKALLAVEKKKRLLAVIWGGKLDVEPRGIVG
jgi:hypothetical protein